MNYRILPHGKDKISEIGLGSRGLAGTEKEIIQVIKAAMEKGINYFDILPAKQDTFFAYAKAFEGCREDIFMQMHFGAVYEHGKYGRTRDLGKIKHYHDLKFHAEDCIRCGHCESFCPFGVKQESRMREIAEYFRKHLQ